MPGLDPPALKQTLRVLLVTDPGVIAGRDWIEVCRSAVQGGVTAVQVRQPLAEPRVMAELVAGMMAALTVPVMVNDRVDVALAVGAAGVHLGADDVPVAVARRVAPDGFIIGASVGDTQEMAGGAGADYWGVGPLHATTTKEAGPPLELQGFAGIVAHAGGIPCVAIGGVMPSDVVSVCAAGGIGVAVVSGILAADDPAQAARSYASAWKDTD